MINTIKNGNKQKAATSMYNLSHPYFTRQVLMHVYEYM